jgi:hypothetical protein
VKKKKTKSLERVIVVETVDEEAISQRLKFKINTEEMRKDMRNKV